MAAQVILRGLDHLALHELDRRRLPAVEYLRHCLDALVQIRKGHQEAQVCLGLGDQLQCHPGQYAQRALRADHQVDQAVAAGVFDDLAA